MPDTSFALKYRPIKIGFLIQENNFEELTSAVGINTLLWGGIFNPIIPINEGNFETADQMLNFFSVDVLCPISQAASIKSFSSKNPFLKSPGNFSENVFYEDWKTHKKLMFYLDSLNVVRHYWEKEFKNSAKDTQSNFLHVSWNQSDPFNNLFSVLFGHFPKNIDFLYDYESSFIHGLRSKKTEIKPGDSLDKDFLHGISPISTTSRLLKIYGGETFNSGIYFGSENNFNDLVTFWNLRASGQDLIFNTWDKNKRLENLVLHFLEVFNKEPNKNPNFADRLMIYFWDKDFESVQNLISNYKSEKPFFFNKCGPRTWEKKNHECIDSYLSWETVKGNVEQKFEKFHLSIPLPEKKFLTSNIENNKTPSQHLAVSLSPIGEYEYPRHTLKPPHIRALNEFYSRQIAFEPWTIRSEKDGISCLIDLDDTSLSLYPIHQQTLIENILGLAGFKTKLSQPGLLAKQITKKMRTDESLEDCQVFKIRGVRILLDSLKGGQTVKWTEAIKMIGENNFKKFKKLFIEPRNESQLSPSDVFAFLIKKKIFSPKLNFLYRIIRKKIKYKCGECGLQETISIVNFEKNWICPYCDSNQYMPAQISNYFLGKFDKYWKFKKSGFFQKDNNQEGAIPVILSLLTFKEVFRLHDYFFSTSLILEKEKPFEVDFTVVAQSRGIGIEIGIAECKASQQKIDQKDVNNLKNAQDSLNSLGFRCYLIFSKTADNFDPAEMELFKVLEKDGRRFILLSNRELETENPYLDLSQNPSVPDKFVFDLAAMSRNSMFLYLGTKNFIFDY